MSSIADEFASVNLTGTASNPNTGLELLPAAKLVDYQHQYLRLLVEPAAVTATGYFLSLLAAVEQLMREAHAEPAQ